MGQSLILSANATPLEGGQGLNLHHMIEGSRGAFDVSVFCRKQADNVSTQEVHESEAGALIGRIPYVRRLRDWRTSFTDAHFDRDVARRITKADVFQSVTGQCLESLGAAKRLGAQTLLDVVTTHINDFGAQQDRECARFGVRPSINQHHRRRIRQEYERADHIRVMSDHARQTFLQHGHKLESVTVISPPVDFASFPQATFSEPKFRVSFVGLIEPWKGFHYLVDAFNALDLPESELVFWGGSGTRPVTRYLQEQIGRNPRIVIKPVEVRRVGYGEVYGKSSVFVQPSLADGFGYVVAEAMASGIPVIVTSSTGAASLVADGENGYIVPPADSDAIRDRLAHLAANPALLQRMGSAARQTAGAETLDKFRERYVSCLKSLLN